MVVQEANNLKINKLLAIKQEIRVNFDNKTNAIVCCFTIRVLPAIGKHDYRISYS